MDYSKDSKKFWRNQIKARGVQALGGKCILCGQVYEDCCFDFHHLEPTKKEFTISQMNTNGARSWLNIRDELKKCTLLCSNCHRLVHNGYKEIEIKNYFNDDFYDWDLCNAKSVSIKTGEVLDANYICPECGGEKSSKAEICIHCNAKKSRIFEVEREELKQMIYTMPFTKVGEYFGVSDNAIRKRCKTFGLPTKKTEIKQYSAEDWEKI